MSQHPGEVTPWEVTGAPRGLLLCVPPDPLPTGFKVASIGNTGQTVTREL
jgi:hypothetical protein